MNNVPFPCVVLVLQVLDVGTGGGLPGLPLAIFYPNVRFTLIDGTGKKIYAVQDMAERLGLTNVRAFHVRAEEVSYQSSVPFQQPWIGVFIHCFFHVLLPHFHSRVFLV